MRIFLFPLLIVIIFYSCTFQPEGDYFVDVNPVTSGVFTIDITNHGDTIHMGERAEVQYQLDVGDKEPQLVQIKIDEEDFIELVPPNFAFNLIGSNYSTGYHLIEFIIYSNTGSGSLADRTGLEHLVASAFFVLHVDVDPPHKIAITKFENDDSKLKITWEKYNRPNFIKYVLYKRLSLNSLDKLVATIEDPNINYAYDENYIGGEANYWVEVYAYSPGNNLPTIGYDSTVNLHTSKIISVKEDSLTSQINVVWDTCKFNNAFYSYRISALSDENRSYYPEEYFLEDINITSTSFEEIPFGGPLDIILEVSSKSFNTTYDTLSYTLGEKSLPFHFLDYHPEQNRYYRIYYDTLHMYGEGVSEVKTILTDIGNTSFEKSFVRNNYLYLLLNTKLYKYLSTNLELQEIIELQDIVGPFDYTQYSSITENGIFVFQKNNRQSPYTYDSLKMVNLESKNVLMSKDWRTQYQSYAISLDGRFFYVNGTIFEWNGNEYIVFKDNPNLIGGRENRQWMGSMITGSYQILSLYDNSSTNDFECVRFDILQDRVEEEISYNGTANYFEFDMISDVLYSQSISEFGNPELYLIKDSGKESLEIIRVAKMGYRKYKYLNDTLFCSTGYKLFLDP